MRVTLTGPGNTQRQAWAIRVRRGGPAMRVLQGVTVHRTTDKERAERSLFAYAPAGGRYTAANGRYRLSLLGFLHGLIGLTLWVEDDRP